VRTIGHLLDRTASIVRPDRSQAGAGFVETTTPIASAVPCRRSPMTASDQDYAASVQVIANHAIYVRPGLDVKRDDVLTIDGVAYEARVVIDPSEPVYRKVLAEEIQVGT